MYILVYITNVYCIIIPSNIRDPTIAEWMYIEQLIIYNNINIDIENIIILLGIRRYIILTMPGRIYKFTKESHTLRTVHLWIYIDASTVCRLRCSFFLCSLFIYQLIKINVFLLISGQFPTEKKRRRRKCQNGNKLEEKLILIRTCNVFYFVVHSIQFGWRISSKSTCTQTNTHMELFAFSMPSAVGAMGDFHLTSQNADFIQFIYSINSLDCKWK